MRRTPLAALALTAALAAGLTACSGEADVLPQAELEQRLQEAAGEGAEVTCNGDLEEQVDAEQTCTVTQEVPDDDDAPGAVSTDGSDVRVVVTEIEDGEPAFDLEPFLAAERLGDAIGASLVEQGLELDAVECAGDLEGEVGASTTCSLVPDALGIGAVTAEVTAVDGLFIDFTFGTVDPAAG